MAVPLRIPRFCWACGKPIKPNQLYCTFCGKSLSVPGQNNQGKPSDPTINGSISSINSQNNEIPQSQINSTPITQVPKNFENNPPSSSIGVKASFEQNPSIQRSFQSNNPSFNSPKPPPNQMNGSENQSPQLSSAPIRNMQNNMMTSDSNTTKILKNSPSNPFPSIQATTMNIEEILVPIKENLDILMRKMVKMEEKVSQIDVQQDQSTLHDDLVSIESRLALFNPKHIEEIQAKLDGLEMKLDIISPDKSMKQIHNRLEKIENALTSVTTNVHILNQKVDEIDLIGIKHDLKDFVRNILNESKSNPKATESQPQSEKPIDTLAITNENSKIALALEDQENAHVPEKSLFELPPFPQEPQSQPKNNADAEKIEEKPIPKTVKKEKEMI